MLKHSRIGNALTITTTAIVALILSAGTAHAGILYAEDASAWDQGSGGANGTGNGGILRISEDLTGITQVNPADPSTWTDTRAWPNDYQGQDVTSLTDNAWIVLDLGANWAKLEMDSMHVWNVSEATGWNRGIATFNLYYSSAPTVAIPVSADSGNLTNGGANVVDYDFQSGGWTQLGGVQNLDRGAEGEAGGGLGTVDGTFDLSSMPSARYIGFEVLTDYGGVAQANRLGLGQVVFEGEVVPTPAALPAGLALLGLAAMRRRRRS